MAKIDKIICPLLNSECIEDGKIVAGEIHACRFWVVVSGKNPQTGADIASGDCALAWTPMLLIENTKQQRHTTASVDRMRTEVATGSPVLNLLELPNDPI